MSIFEWNPEKNRLLQSERRISFEEIVYAIMNGGLLDVLEHPNQSKYPGQRIYVVLFKEYVYLVPFVTDGDVLFLKTIIPSRKATRQYLKR